MAFQCPHCLTEKAAFAAVGAVSVGHDSRREIVFFQCQICGRGLVVEFQGSNAPFWMAGAAPSPGPIFESYPKVRAPKAPADVPPNVRAAYLDGLDNLRRQKPNPAVAMFRRALELGVRAVDPNAPKGTPLIQRLKRLGDDLITPAMKQWADLIRLGGNEALHDPEDFSAVEADQLKTFTELFLTYAFALPAMLERARNPKDASG